MKRFNAIEGLRGWLAWTVVFAHLAQVSNFALASGAELGYRAVLTFVIVSGFVITNLIVEKPEPYGIYILRRFMRIFPVFAVTCAVGYFASDVQAWTFSRISYASDPSFTLGPIFVDIARSNHQYFWTHVIAHLTMLHGAIGNNILPFSQYAFNSPAWSLSLEWQFYLIAPCVVMLAQRRAGIVGLALALLTLLPLYRFGLFGDFLSPSFLPGAAGYFGVGIASRLAYPIIASSVGRLVALALLTIALLLLSRLKGLPIFLEYSFKVGPLLIWMFVLVGIVAKPVNKIAELFLRMYRMIFEGNVAAYCGSRSYSVYLCHLPIIAFCHLLVFSKFPEAQPPFTYLALTAISLPTIAITAELFYRSVERPGILLGSRLATRLKSNLKSEFNTSNIVSSEIATSEIVLSPNSRLPLRSSDSRKEG